MATVRAWGGWLSMGSPNGTNMWRTAAYIRDVDFVSNEADRC